MVINPIVEVLYPVKGVPIKGGMTIPNIRSLDPRTYTRRDFRADFPEVPRLAGAADCWSLWCPVGMRIFVRGLNGLRFAKRSKGES